LKSKSVNLKITALDISKKALLVAKRNFDYFSIKADLIKSDLLEKIPNHSYFDLITANLQTGAVNHIKSGFVSLCQSQMQHHRQWQKKAACKGTNRS